MKAIQAIVTDVDGVMVGKQPGIDFPLPHQSIITALKHVAASGVPIVLCTAKFNYAIKAIAIQAELNNPHITDGGALIVSFKHDEDGNDALQIITEHTIQQPLVNQFVTACLHDGIYIELCSSNAYYVDPAQQGDFTKRRSDLLQQKPKLRNATDVADHETIIKMIGFIKDKEQAEQFKTIMNKIGSGVDFIWSHHPYLVPYQPAIVTAANVSKAHATKEVSQLLNFNLKESLGIGDTASDWNFMSLCGNVGVVGDQSVELARDAMSKREGHYYIAPDVEHHGLLEILRYFECIK